MREPIAAAEPDLAPTHAAAHTPQNQGLPPPRPHQDRVLSAQKGALQDACKMRSACEKVREKCARNRGTGFWWFPNMPRLEGRSVFRAFLAETGKTNLIRADSPLLSADILLT
jgi:hypothetical protein